MPSTPSPMPNSTREFEDKNQADPFEGEHGHAQPEAMKGAA